ncbi:Nucleoside-diphosphate-sugar epimerase [Myroides marinus]|uniref:Nucleoside-diphosphate-sugar epimerase n=1 Tax=Myroides marinus TaxID=703342 RepID=A0A1H6WAL4_9FLAO|nr:SDR family oxidoreductase [Myroides marinus]SEJ11097.1 Nucleoside-diphosphate-sugar epimerase [Myroides marinus]
MKNIALVVGVSGIAGSNLAKELIAQDWIVYGLARNPKGSIEGVIPVVADLLDTEGLAIALKEITPTHVFFTTWMRQATEAENIIVNATLVRNLLDTLSPKKCVMHVALVTGLKHYLGPFEAYASSGTLPKTPVREEHPRLDLENFYYAQEDEVYAAAERDGFTWSIHRPHTLIGHAVGNLMNMGITLAVNASICKVEGLPMVWPGSEAQWNGVSDITDVRILAKQLVWAATTPEAANQAFNVTNGDVFRWKWLWEEIANYFEIPFEGYNGSVRPLESVLLSKEKVWQSIVQQCQLQPNTLSTLVSPWHTDADLGRPIEVFTDMSKSRKLGFTAYKSTKDSFIELFEQLREEQLIP